MRYIFYFTLAFFYINSAIGHDLLCKNWLTGNIIHDDTSVDKFGVRGKCRDYFPTWGEREKIERVSSDPFDSEYRITRQYCWGRFILDGSNKCGAPSISKWCLGFIPCEFSWNSPSYTSWGDTKRGSARAYEISSECKDVTLISGFNTGSICQFSPKVIMRHGQVNNKKRVQVCGYYKPSGIPGLIIGKDEWSSNLIGCVDAPLKPGPRTFNKSVLLGSSIYADPDVTIKELMNHGSTFNNPIIKVKYQIVDPETGDAKSGSYFLQAKLDEEEIYGKVPECIQMEDYGHKTMYCAKVPKDDPKSVCICESSKCDQNVFIGCNNRPTPKQSNISIIGEYFEDSDKDGQKYPSMKLFFVKHSKDDNDNINLDITDANDKEVIISDGIYYAKHNETLIDPSLPLKYKNLLPIFVNEDYVIREYYNFKFLNPEKNKEIQQNTVRGSVELYGIPFKVIIPSMKNNEIESIYLKELSGGEFDVMRSCNQVCDNAEGIRKHYIFGGIRDKIECCVDPSIGNCIIKQNQPIDAKKAVCPGAYLAPSDKIGDGDRICIIPDIDWPEIMEKPFCLQIPRKGCDEINLISPVTLNAAWSALKSGETGYGRCPTEIGMESQKIVSFKDAHDCGTQSNQKNAYKDFQALINRAQSENRNVYKEEINRIAHKNSCSSINFSEKEVKIKRKCYINFYAPIESDVEGENGECRMKMGCAEISDITISQYNTLWPETKPINPEDAIKTIDEKYNIITQSKIVYGTCPEGYKSIDDQGKDVSWKPYRNCIGKYYYDAKEKKKKLLYSYWGEVIGSCTRDKNLQ